MLQLFAAFILFSEASLNDPAMLVRGKLLSRTCPDEELGLECDAACYQKYLGCKADCDSSTCERHCLALYTGCCEDCPCFFNCPQGCDGCPNPICKCNKPQVNNEFYRHCMDEATDNWKNCIMESDADEDAYDVCIADFKVASRKCPCNSECSTGCPCERGYECQEFVIATWTECEPCKLYQNRHYLSPQSSGPVSYYPFIYRAGFALLNGQIFIFGGDHDSKKIAKIELCEIMDTGKRLINTFYSYHGSTVTVPEVHDEIVLCKGYGATACETFDGEVSILIASTKAVHDKACMALFKNQATIIAGEGTGSVETLAVSGWTQEPSHPSGSANQKFAWHACISIDDRIITTGGYDGSTWLKSVYFFKNEEWKNVGELSNTYKWGSMIAVEGAFLVFGGDGQSNMVERAEWNGDVVVSTRNVTDHGGDCQRPILFHTQYDTCKDFCSENFCYN